MDIDRSADWLEAVAAHPETIDTDLIVAQFLAQSPGKLWSLTDVLHELQHERELSDLSDAVDELVSDGFLESVAVDLCDEPSHDGGPGDYCTDPLCCDMLFRIRHPEPHLS